MRDGVQAGDWWFPGYALPGGDERDRFALFAVPYDMSDVSDVKLVAIDDVDRDHLGLLRLLFGGVGNDDPAGGLFFCFDAAHENSVVQRTKCHNDDLSSESESLNWHSRVESASEGHLGAAPCRVNGSGGK